jgi:hypothetical protein
MVTPCTTETASEFWGNHVPSLLQMPPQTLTRQYKWAAVFADERERERERALVYLIAGASQGGVLLFASSGGTPTTLC